MPGIILPRKTVHELHRLMEDSGEMVKVGVSPAKARFGIGTITLTSKLIDGTFPDYGRVIPKSNDKDLRVPNADFKSAVDLVSKVIDGAGVIVVVIGLVLATAAFARDPSYRVYRQQVGRAILLGLEFLVAADIIRTIAVDPTFTSVGVLAIVVLVRTFLSFSLDIEMDGVVPWRRRASEAPPGP